MFTPIDTKSHVTAYYQLHQLLKKRILNRELLPGERLPNEYELGSIYNVSRITVRKALGHLEQEGYVERHRGKGTYVTIPKIEQQMSSFYSLSDTFAKMGMQASNRITHFKHTKPPARIKSFFPGPDARVWCFKRLRYADGLLYAIESTWLPLALFPSLNEKMLAEHSMYNLMRNHFNVVPERAQETVNAINMSEAHASLFGLRHGSAAFLVERITYLGDVVIEYTESEVRGDKYKLRLSLDKK